MSDNLERYGPNLSKLSKILFCAVSSWGGFIYQGCCALCVALEQILDDKDKVKSNFLNIEGYDDFAILDKDKHILSFHQAKCYKSEHDFKEDMALMEDKRAYWCEKGVCPKDALLKFHSNQSVTCHHNVEQYEYSNGKKDLTTGNVLNLLKDLVDSVLEQNEWPGNTEAKVDSLISLMDKKVSFLDEESKKGKERLQLSIEESISFAEIIEKLQQTETNYSIDDRLRTISFYLNLNLQERILEETDKMIDCSKVNHFLDTYDKLPKIEKQNLIKRLFPHYNVGGRRTNLGDLTNEEVANYLYNVLTQTEVMNPDKFHWEENEQLHSPSVLGKSKPSKNYCGMIAKNRGNLPPELLRDYRWIVGDLTNTIQDLLEEAHLINAIGAEDYKNIVKSRKVGLLTIKDKIDGNI